MNADNIVAYFEGLHHQNQHAACKIGKTLLQGKAQRQAGRTQNRQDGCRINSKLAQNNKHQKRIQAEFRQGAQKFGNSDFHSGPFEGSAHHSLYKAD